MKTEEKRTLSAGLLLLAAFILWTVLIQCVDVQPLGQNGTDIGFAALNYAAQNRKGAEGDYACLHGTAYRRNTVSGDGAGTVRDHDGVFIIGDQGSVDAQNG